MTFFLGGEMAMWADDYCFVDQCFLYKRGKPNAWWIFGSESDSQFTESVSGIVSIFSCKYSKLPLMSPLPTPTYKFPQLQAYLPVNKTIHPVISPPPHPLPDINLLSPHLQVSPVTGPFTCKKKTYNRLSAPAKFQVVKR